MRNSADAEYAQKSKNQKNDASEALSWFHNTHYTCELRFRQQILPESVTNRSEQSEYRHSAMTAKHGSRKTGIHVAPRVKSCISKTLTLERRLCALSKIGNSSVNIYLVDQG